MNSTIPQPVTYRYAPDELNMSGRSLRRGLMTIHGALLIAWWILRHPFTIAGAVLAYVCIGGFLYLGYPGLRDSLHQLAQPFVPQTGQPPSQVLPEGVLQESVGIPPVADLVPPQTPTPPPIVPAPEAKWVLMYTNPLNFDPSQRTSVFKAGLTENGCLGLLATVAEDQLITWEKAYGPLKHMDFKGERSKYARRWSYKSALGGGKREEAGFWCEAAKAP